MSSAIIASNEGSYNHEPIPAGNHLARCIRMYHIGTVLDSYMGQPKEMNKVVITWELPQVRKVFDQAKGEQPSIISEEYTLSMGDKAKLRLLLESWRGKKYTEEELKGVDITRVISQPCLLNVVHVLTKKGHTMAKVSSIAPLYQGAICPQQENPSIIFGYNPFDINVYHQLPKWIAEKVQKSKEFMTLYPQGAPVNPNAQQQQAPVQQPVAQPQSQQFQQPVQQPMAQPVMQPQVQQQPPVSNMMNQVVASDSLPF
jgi:hypothetical protein